MSRRQYISNQKKQQIANLYNDSGLSIGAIADKLGVSVRTVHNYKNYKDQDNSNIEKSERNDSDMDQISNLNSESNEIEPESEAISKIKEHCCPDCGKPVSELLTVKQAINQDLTNVKNSQLWLWEYFCQDCDILITFKKCPGCGANPDSFVDIYETNANDREKQNFDFVCSKCNELINVDELEEEINNHIEQENNSIQKEENN